MNFAIYGDIIYSTELNSVTSHKDSYLICENGISQGVFKQLLDKYKGIKIYDYRDDLVIPELIDLHLHAPQYSLLDFIWTFPEEAKYNIEYAKEAYDIFINDLKFSPTTQFNIFSTIHVLAPIYLMKQLDKIGMKGFVGKVNMDRNCPKNL